MRIAAPIQLVWMEQTNFFSVEHSLDAWIKANGCEATPTVTELPDKADDGTKVVRKVWG